MISFGKRSFSGFADSTYPVRLSEALRAFLLERQIAGATSATISALFNSTQAFCRFVDARYAALGGALEPTDQWEYDRIIATLRTALEADDLNALTARGALLHEDEAIAEALRA